MKNNLARSLTIVVCAAVAVSGQSLSSKRLERVDRYFQEEVDQQQIAGAVALVLQDGKPVYEKAFGWADKEAKQKMAIDSIFRIASQSKALTSVVILSLMEEGKLGLNDPAGRFIPTFMKTTVAMPSGIEFTTVPAKRPITIKDLLTHTAGVSYGEDRFLVAAYKAKNVGPVLGCIAEKASGQPLDQLIRSRITDPLGMKDTMFYLPATERERLVAVYASNADTGGTIFRAPDGPLGQGNYVDGPRRSFAGGAGLLSTARDYARLLETIRRGGELDGVRILSPRSVELMTTNQIGTLHSDTGLGFGLGFETTDRYGANGLDEVGAFGWGGAYGSNYRVDPKSRLVLVMMINQMPLGATAVRERFPTLVYQSLQ